MCPALAALGLAFLLLQGARTEALVEIPDLVVGERRGHETEDVCNQRVPHKAVRPALVADLIDGLRARTPGPAGCVSARHITRCL